MVAPKAPATLVPCMPSSSFKSKVVDDDTLEELIKAIIELKVETSALKNGHMLSISRPTDGSKGFIMWCIHYDDPNHKCADCKHFADNLKVDIVIFRNSMIKDIATSDPLPTNVDKGGVKKIIDDN